MVEIIQNFVIREGRVFDLRGNEIVGPNGVWEPRKDRSKRMVPRLPQMRWKNGSYLTLGQTADEKYQIKMKIA